MNSSALESQDLGLEITTLMLILTLNLSCPTATFKPGGGYSGISTVSRVRVKVRVRDRCFKGLK